MRFALIAVCAAACATARPTPPRDETRAIALGATFTLPAGWRATAHGDATLLAPPEAGSTIALVGVRGASDPNAAIAAAWRAIDRGPPPTVRSSVALADRDGWTQRWKTQYASAPAERRSVEATAMRAGDAWAVVVYDVADAVGERRYADIQTIVGHLWPAGYRPESFAGRRPHALDAARIEKLAAFVERARVALEIPGIAVGVVQDGKIVMLRGFGTRALGGTEPVDADTRFMIASNTKSLTTLLLARLVDRGALSWDAPVAPRLPGFGLGSVTKRVLVKHLVCACTGIPSDDIRGLVEFAGRTPADLVAEVARVEPTTGFGETFQYSNQLAAIGGFLAGHVAHPDLELGAAYVRAMQDEVFGPLGMTRTTLAAAPADNVALGYAPDVDGHAAPAVTAINGGVQTDLPAGAAWSTARDLLAYVQVELSDGLAPDGTRYVSRSALRERRIPQVRVGADTQYGIGLMIESAWGVPMIHHGGALIGYKSDFFVMPDQRVGAVLLTSSDAGRHMLYAFRRELLELLYDGARAEADATLAARAKSMRDELADARAQLSIPAAPTAAAALAARYAGPALGELTVRRRGAAVDFDFGEWRTEVATRASPDGTVSFVTIGPGVDGNELVPGTTAAGARTLTWRDEQHEYVFTEVPSR